MSQTYIWPFLEILQPGYLIRIRGIVNKNPDRFHVNLQNGLEYSRSDLILRTSFRFSREGTYLENNSKKESVWMLEEVLRDINLEAGSPFELLILCDTTRFHIALNNKHLCDYDHKMPYTSVRGLSIHGDVTLTLMSYEDNTTNEKPSIGVHYPLLSYNTGK